MTMPTKPSNASTLGYIVHEYAGNGFRLTWTVIWAAVTTFGLIASISQGSGTGILFWLASGAGCYAYYYFVQRDAHAEIFEQGFSISRGGKTISGRWEDIAKVEHWVKKSSMFGVVTVSADHSFIVVLKNGTRVKVTSAFKQSEHLGNVIQRKWTIANS